MFARYISPTIRLFSVQPNIYIQISLRTLQLPISNLFSHPHYLDCLSLQRTNLPIPHSLFSHHLLPSAPYNVRPCPQAQQTASPSSHIPVQCQARAKTLPIASRNDPYSQLPIPSLERKPNIGIKVQESVTKPASQSHRAVRARQEADSGRSWLR